MNYKNDQQVKFVDTVSRLSLLIEVITLLSDFGFWAKAKEYRENLDRLNDY